MSTVVNTQNEAGCSGGRRDLPTGMLERITLVLDAFDTRTAMLNLEEVVRRTALPRSTAHRILEQLVKLEWLQRDHPGYAVGRRALGVERRDTSHTDLRQVAGPHLHRLCMRTGMLVVLSVLEGAEELVLDKLGGPHAGRMGPIVGRRGAAYLSSGGRAMLSALPATTVEALSQQWEPAAGRASWSPHKLPKLRKELEAIERRRGLSIREPGTRPGSSGSVSAVVHGPESTLAAISLIEAPGGRTLEQAAPWVLEVSRRVSHELCQEYEQPLRAVHSL